MSTVTYKNNEQSNTKSTNNDQQNSKSNKPSNSKLGRMSNFFTQQKSSENPFGPNYKQLDYNTKIKFKYGLMKQFFKPQSKDQYLKSVQQQKFLGTIILGFVAGYYAIQIPSKIYQTITKRVTLNQFKAIGMITTMCISTTLSYKIANDRYTQKVSKYFLDKYLNQAIQNGFEDYQISN